MATQKVNTPCTHAKTLVMPSVAENLPGSVSVFGFNSSSLEMLISVICCVTGKAATGTFLFKHSETQNLHQFYISNKSLNCSDPLMNYWFSHY